MPPDAILIPSKVTCWTGIGRGLAAVK